MTRAAPLPIDGAGSAWASTDAPEPPDPDWLHALAEAAGSGDRDAWAELVALGLEHRDAPASIERITLAVGEAAMVWLRDLLSATARETRDVSPLLGQAGMAVGCLPREDDWLALIREVTARECCERHAFLAAALAGMAQGIERAGHPPAISPEAVWRLAELAGHPDPALAAAARRAQPHFRTDDEPGPVAPGKERDGARTAPEPDRPVDR